MLAASRLPRQACRRYVASGDGWLDASVFLVLVLNGDRSRRVSSVSASQVRDPQDVAPSDSSDTAGQRSFD